MTLETFLGRRIAELDPPVRGDPITGERYYSQRWAKAEWDNVWSKVWHIGGMAADLEEPGDFLTHNIGRESVVMLRQEDGGVRAFFNACKHRGYRLAWGDFGNGPNLVCGYHGWRYGPDGRLLEVQDPENFSAGNPCTRLKLDEIQCEVWAGFVWYNMDTSAPSLREFLGPIADQLDCWQMGRMKRVMAFTTTVPCNWKIVRDNFNEAYHIPTLHPQIAGYIDDDHEDTVFEIYGSGHGRMVMKGAQPSGRYPIADILEPALSDALAAWDLDPTGFTGRATEARKAIMAQKRVLFREKGYPHYETMGDSEIVDYHLYTLFPNISFSMWPDGCQLLRSEPHPTDPEKCIFDHWFMAQAPGKAEGDMVMGPLGPTPFRAVERTQLVYGEQTLGEVCDQDLIVAVGQQEGLHSRGYSGGNLSDQEKRVQAFHETLNDICDIHD